jgi:hypothetical protein
MKTRTITIRVDEQLAAMLAEINTRPTTAAQNAIYVFTWIRRKTLHDLKGVFTSEEVMALVNSFNSLLPSKQIIESPSAFLDHTIDAEKYEHALSACNADPEKLFEKLSALSPAQSVILQLELHSFWNANDNARPDLDDFISRFS